MLNSETRQYFTGLQQTAFVVLRIAIGWHFLREGVIKLSHPTWTAAGYLTGSWGPFSKIFNWMATQDWMMSMINVFMPWALTLAGLGLMLGLFTRCSILLSMGLLAMFIAAAPPWDPGIVSKAADQVFNFPGFMGNMVHAQWAENHLIGCEGNYMMVNKNMIEFIALGALLLIDTGKMAGFDAVLSPYIAKIFNKQ